MTACPDGALVYPHLAQHFVNGLAIAVQQFHLQDQPTPIPVESTKHAGLYRSAVALTLGQDYPAKVAQELGAIAQSYLSEQCQLECEVTTDISGWITLQTSLATQWACLTQIANVAPIFVQPPQHSGQPAIAPELVFELQYAHARCCSLLKLAQPMELDKHKLSAQWLNAYASAYPAAFEPALWAGLLTFPTHLLDSKRLFPTLPPAYQATCAMQTTTVVPFPITHKRLHDLGQTWGQLFQKFYSDSRLFGLSLPADLDLLTLRFTLFQALKNVLDFTLTKIYHRPAPEIL